MGALLTGKVGMNILPSLLVVLLIGLQAEAFPHHFLVLRRGINPNIVEHLPPIKGISTSYGYHPSKRMRPVIVEKAPKSPSDFKEPIGGGADSLANEIMFDLQFLLDDEQPCAAASGGADSLKAVARSLQTLLDPDDPKRLLRIS